MIDRGYSVAAIPLRTLITTTSSIDIDFALPYAIARRPSGHVLKPPPETYLRAHFSNVMPDTPLCIAGQSSRLG